VKALSSNPSTAKTKTKQNKTKNPKWVVSNHLFTSSKISLFRTVGYQRGEGGEGEYNGVR
jgi:hypothetical protein